jgi:predicted metal-dependent peptidase
MFNLQLTPQQRVDKNVIKIMGHERYMAMAGIMMIGERCVVVAIPNWPFPNMEHTACTNGRDEWYAHGFIEGMSDKKLRGLLIHESYHKMMRHLVTWAAIAAIDAHCANQAMDHWINIRITDDNKVDGFAEIPDGGCCDFRFRGMNTMQIFTILREEKKKEQEEREKEKGDGEGEEGESSGGDGQGEGEPAEDEGEDETTGVVDVHDWEGAKALTDQEKHDLEKDVDEAIRQGALAAGKSGSGGNRDIDELMETQVDWREVLREFVASTCAGNDYSTWRMPSKRYIAGGIYMPRGISEAVGELCIEIDMSGSTWHIVKYFMTELVAICKQVRPEIVRIIYWDTQVTREEKFTQDNIDDLLTLTQPRGGCGTIVSCVPDYCNEHGIKPQAHIVLTDGWLAGDWGKGWNAPVLWCVCDNKKAVPSHGKIVHIDSSNI